MKNLYRYEVKYADGMGDVGSVLVQVMANNKEEADVLLWLKMPEQVVCARYHKIRLLDEAKSLK